MRSYLRPVLIGLTGFLIGGACVYAFLKSSAAPETGRSYHSDKPIISALNLPKNDEDKDVPPPLAAPSAPSPQARSQGRSNDEMDEDEAFQNPFAAMRKMREQMEREMRAGLGGGMGFDMEADDSIITKEDDKSVSYEIKDVVGGSLNTSVKGGYLTVSGESKQVNGSISVQSSFHRTFPLPRYVDASKMETISEKDRVILRFPKKS